MKWRAVGKTTKNTSSKSKPARKKSHKLGLDLNHGGAGIASAPPSCFEKLKEARRVRAQTKNFPIRLRSRISACNRCPMSVLPNGTWHIRHGSSTISLCASHSRLPARMIATSRIFSIPTMSASENILSDRSEALSPGPRCGKSSATERLSINVWR